MFLLSEAEATVTEAMVCKAAYEQITAGALLRRARRR